MIQFSDVQRILKINKEDDELFSSKTGNPETNAHFYHVIQKSGNGDIVFNGDSGKYRNNQFRNACITNNVAILFSVVMGNHTHDLIMVSDFEVIKKIYRVTNTNTSRYIHSLYPKRYKIPGNKVYGERPCIKAIKTLEHLFYLPYYLMNNVRECEQSGFGAPYSCFQMMEQGYFPKPYYREIFESIFGIKMEDYLKALHLPKAQFMDYMKSTLSKIPSGSEDLLLKINPTRPW